MKRIWLIALGLILIASPPAVEAGWDEFWQEFHTDYQRNNYWPHPFRQPVVQQTLAPFEVMKNNGWRAHNTIGDELFRPGDQVLSEAGVNRLRWIVSQAPRERRIVFVLQASTAEETKARVAAVNKTIDSMYLTGVEPRVLVTDIRPAATSGEWHTKLNRSRLDNQPVPALPAPESTTND